MEIHPRYDTAPAIEIACSLDDIRTPLLRQRRRLAELVATLSDEQMAAQTRCDAWTVADVLSHLAGTDRFWAASLAGGLAGTPTKFLLGFDPEATPAQMVEADRGRAVDEVRAVHRRDADALCAAVENLETGDGELTAEAPPGHLTIRTLLHHALWDCWIHERDIAVPLGLDAPVEDDEVTACLRYAVALSPSFAVSQDPSRAGILSITSTEPDADLRVDIGHTVVVADAAAPADAATTVAGTAVDLVEAFSVRADPTFDVPDASRWMVEGLAEVFRPAS